MGYACVAVYRTQEHCSRSTYAGSILVVDFIEVEKTYGESGGFNFVCIRVTSNSVAATVNSQGQ